jgi:hypothetical protein
MVKFFNGNDFDGDCLILQSYLQEMKFYSGTDRNKLRDKGDIKIKKGSMLYGYTWRGYMTDEKWRTPSDLPGLYNTKCKDDYPLFQNIAEEFTNLYYPDFTWYNIQLNYNFKIMPHFDNKNVGESIIIGLGDYEGGALNVEFENGVKKIDIKHKFFKFDGSKYKHWIDDYTGDRYSVVFFKNKQIMNRVAEQKK